MQFSSVSKTYNINFFRDQCEELRSTLSKRQQDEVCVERLQQLRVKDAISQAKREEDDMYARLWEEDRLVKAAREEQDAKAAYERNQEVLKVYLCFLYFSIHS